MKGFTLIELLVIISIIAILAGIGIPVFRDYQPVLQLSAAVKDLTTDLRYVSQLAVTEQVGHGIRFVIATNEYQIIRQGATEEIIKIKSLPKEVRFQEIVDLTNNEVIFNSFGAVREAGRVTLINTQSATKTIDIRPSGFVRILR